MSYRITQINELIRNHISEILLKELDLKPGVFLTITRVDTSADLRYARVFVSIFPEIEADYALKTIKGEIYAIQGRLNKKLDMKPLPRIEFEVDSTETKADEIEKILKSIH